MKNGRSHISLAVLCIALVGGFGAPAWEMPADGQKLRQLLHDLRWVAYSPTNYNPELKPPVLPSASSIRADLETLRAAGCTGLVTYGASLPEIVDIAESLEFRGLLLGVWDPTSDDELLQAQRSASNRIVTGIIVGNEGLMFKRYDQKILKHAMDFLRQSTGKPVSTTEVIESFYTIPELRDWSDFITLNVHPYFHGYNDATHAANWTVASWKRLLSTMPHGKPVLFKEVGLPTAPEAGFGESGQELYYRLLQETPVQFVFFEAFDQLFKHGTVEQSWGLFRADRRPKAAASVLKSVERSARH